MSAMFDNNSTNPPMPASRYRALNPLAVTGTVLAALSIVTALHWGLAVVPIAAIIVGWIALRQIHKAPDEWTGLRLAQIGLGLATAMWVVGYGWLIFAKASEVPFGYHPITYDTLQPDPARPTDPLPQAALDMQDRKIYITGYMQPRRQQTGIREFILCPNNGECPFCIPNPRPTEMIRVILQGDMSTVYSTNLVRVAGRFRVDPNDATGIPYAIEVDYLK
jgi:hypothetical protein